ncbi:MAG TPA: TetR/AcrR family transcriptional regulator [Polyangia bacterium]|nr:TetR/AcrR family transcriptional regulator [Polyangia bacterium]
MAAKKRYHHGDLREQLLAAVAAIIREHGLGFLSLREVARHAGVSHGAPAHHFKNKAGMLTAFAAQGFERLARTVLQAASASGARDGAAALEALGAAYVRFAVENPEQFSVMFRPQAVDDHDTGLVVAREAAYGVLFSTMHRCAREGFLEGLELELATISAWSIVHGLAALWLSGRLADRLRERQPDRVAHSVSRLFVDAVLRKRLRPRAK